MIRASPACVLLTHKFAKVIDLIEHGQANKAVTADAEVFLRAVYPSSPAIPFFQATFWQKIPAFTGLFRLPNRSAQSSKRKTKDRPPDAPTLRRKPTP